jgi:hypothetical protein
MVTVLQNGLCIQSQMVPSYKRRCPNIFTIQLYLYTKVSALIYLLHNNMVTLKWQNYLPIDESERGGPVQNRRNHHQGEDRGQVAFGNDGAASDDDIVRASWWPIFFKKKQGEDRGQVAFRNGGAVSDDDIVRASWWPKKNKFLKGSVKSDLAQ